MEANDKNLYFDLQKQERDAVMGYLLDTLLHARAACHIPSNEKTYDEDVNIYLAHLLMASSLPDYQKLTSRYLALNTSDLTEFIDQHEDKVVRYFIYKVNADYLLLHLGIFHDLAPLARRPFQKSERQFVEMGQSYYESASQYNHQIYRKQTAVGDVLEKLSHHFEDYQKILHVLREDFFRLMKKIGSGDSQKNHDSGKFQMFVSSLELEQKHNEFLDLYGEWLETKSRDLVTKIIQLVDEIKRLDPTFGFDVASMMPDGDRAKRED